MGGEKVSISTPRQVREGFWEDRAKTGTFSSGFEDPHAERLEWDALRSAVETHLDRPASRRVLEIGCHVGYTSSKLFKVMAPSKYEALDISPASIETASRHKHELGFQEINFFVASAAEVPRPDECYDTLISVRCIQNIQNPEEQLGTFREIERLLEPGGIAIVVENWQEELTRLNGLRREAAMEPISSPNHTRFLRRSELIPFIERSFEVLEERSFISAYYFGTRFAKWLDPSVDAKDLNSEYNSFFAGLNQIQFGIRLGPTMYILRKGHRGGNRK